MTLFGGWRARVGFLPHAVDVFEHGERGLVLYLRWRPGKTVDGRWHPAGAWQYRSLKLTFDQLIAVEFSTLRPDKARKAAEAWARERAQEQVERNRGVRVDAPAAEPPPPPPAPARLTLRAGWALAVDRERGKYPPTTDYNRAVGVAMRHAMDVWGADTAWEDLRVGDWRQLWRRRFRDVRAAAGTRVTPRTGLAAGLATVVHVLAVIDWLREEDHLRHVTLPPGRWKKKATLEFAREFTDGVLPTHETPRYTSAEIGRLLTAARTGEPRVALLLALGAELRPGQVLRSHRRDLTLPAVDWTAPVPPPPADDPTDYGVAVIHGSGHKEGEEVYLTRGQRIEVERALRVGYLRDLEAAYQAGTLRDYPLFPGGKLPGRSAGDPVATLARHATARPWAASNARLHFETIEAAAKIAHVPGRSFYGIRRGTVDQAVDADVSVAALRHLGGWAHEATPRDIYASRQSVRGRQDARQARRRLRAEPADQAPASPPAPAVSEASPTGERVNSASTPQPSPRPPRGRRSASHDSTEG